MPGRRLGDACFDPEVLQHSKFVWVRSLVKKRSLNHQEQTHEVLSICHLKLLRCEAKSMH